MLIRIFPEATYENLGAVRYCVTWHIRKPFSPENDDEIGFEDDLEWKYFYTPKWHIAKAKAQHVANESFFGSATVQKQIVDWLDHDDHSIGGEWSNAGEAQEYYPK